VAIERMCSVIKSTRFSKKKSQKVSKWIILSIFIFTILTHIHDPIHRQLIDDFDIDEYRIWCFVQYSSSLNRYNSFITFFHFLIPFSINIISALWIIITLTYNRSGMQHNGTFQEQLKQQLKQHRHILISPCMLILLTLPRVIISFISGCMRSPRDSWLHLIGYFVSFIPSMLTFIVFVLPSKNYKTEFNTVVKQTIRRFHATV
jgi:di/tricarboxylate transporter